MATWAPTARARAPTVLNVEQSSELHTAKLRMSPTTGGVGAMGARGAAAAGADRSAAAAANDRARPRARSMPSNRVAAARGDAGSAKRCPSMAVAARVAVRSWKGDDSPKVPATDCGTSRYSAESTDALAGNVTHPPSEAGSIEAYAPITSVRGDASAELHVGGVLGPVVSWLHAAVARSAQVTIRSAVRCFISTSALASRDDPQAPMLTRNCTLRGLPSDAPLKNGPFSAYLLSNRFSIYTCGRITVAPTANV